MDQIINHAVLSLDFWQDTVTYEGSTMPTGTIGCEVLNIPDSTIEKLDTPCNVLNQLLQGMNTGSVDMELLPQVQQAAGEIISFLQVTPPFSRLNRSYFEQKLAAIFSEEYMEDAKAYLQLTQQEQLICALTGQYERSSLGKESLRRWYAVILCQWMEGTGLSFIMKKAIEYRRDHPENFRVSMYQPPTTYNDRSKEH